MAKLKKIKGGLKNKGMRNASWDKLESSSNESAKHAPHDQMEGSSEKKLKVEHVAAGNQKKPE